MLAPNAFATAQPPVGSLSLFEVVYLVPGLSSAKAWELAWLDEVDGLLPRRVKCHNAVVRSCNEESRP
jgi:hypothetical protein